MGKNNSITWDPDLLLAEETLVVDVLEDLLEALDAKGMSQAELARRLGVSRSAVNRILRGDNLTVRTVARFAHAMGTRVSFRIGSGGSEDLARIYQDTTRNSMWRSHSSNNVYIFPRGAVA